MFEDGQLGSTNVVTHSINTGDNPINTGNSLPIKQPARHIPFALRRKVEELVDDMLQKQVIHPPIQEPLGKFSFSCCQNEWR